MFSPKWTDDEIARLQQAVADRLDLPSMAPLFPNRTKDAIKTRMCYLLRGRHTYRRRPVREDDEPISNSSDVAARMNNEKRDGAFQAALRAAIEAGLERMPAPEAPNTEIRWSRYQPIAPGSGCSSAGQLCTDANIFF